MVFWPHQTLVTIVIPQYISMWQRLLSGLMTWIQQLIPQIATVAACHIQITKQESLHPEVVCWAWRRLVVHHLRPALACKKALRCRHPTFCANLGGDSVLLRMPSSAGRMITWPMLRLSSRSLYAKFPPGFCDLWPEPRLQQCRRHSPSVTNQPSP